MWFPSGYITQSQFCPYTVGLNFGPQTWLQAPLPSEPTRQPQACFSIVGIFFFCLEVSWAVAAFLFEYGEQGKEIIRFVKEEEKDEGAL